MTEVVAGLIWDGDRFLICQRPAGKKRGLLWEFAGGKMEPGETREQTLVREFQEELGVTLKPLDVFMDVTHEYPDMTVHMTLYNAVIAEGELQKLEHNDLRWIRVDEIDGFDFCPADVEILDRLKGRKDYHKLVRDRIPEVIRASGGSSLTEELDDETYLELLDQKLDEELLEYHADGNVEELADLLEVIYAAAAARGCSAADLDAIRAEKAAKRGAFEKKLLLKASFYGR
ncbi:MAG: NUDIX domain-containing protein [Oscillospiraceae bacterium]|nr:NUDIX domain-containing protein [Oscillospiraceae bacterium]